MFDLFWDFDRLSKVECNLKRRSWDLNPLFRDFRVLGLCNRYGMSAHGFTHVWAHFVMYK